MSIDFIRPEVEELRPRISVIGVGGAGGNAIANMIQSEVQGVDFIVANTDAQALNHSLADRKIQLGLKITQGLGAEARLDALAGLAAERIGELQGLAVAGLREHLRTRERGRHRIELGADVHGAEEHHLPLLELGSEAQHRVEQRAAESVGRAGGVAHVPRVTPELPEAAQLGNPA